MRKISKRKKQDQKKYIIITSLVCLLFFSVGYAAFQTSITLTAKGNVIPATTYTVDELKETVVDAGDGLYVDTAEQGRYSYKGGNPNNYLTLNGETWRIMSIEPDNTIKIIREESIGSVVFDPGRTTTIAGITENGSDVGTRYSTVSTDFCYFSSNNYGCKVWGSKDTMRNSEGVLLKDASGDGSAKMPRIVNNATTYDLPNDEAYLNIYLNGGSYAGVPVAGWYNTWSSSLSAAIRSYIVEDHIYNVGLVSDSSGQLIERDIAQEKAHTWKGRVGLMSASEYVRASTNSACTGVYAYRNTSSCYNNGATHNYLRKTTTQWLLSPRSDSYPSFVWHATSTNLYNNDARATSGVRPVLYLSSNVKLKGDGTTGKQFQIKIN